MISIHQILKLWKDPFSPAWCCFRNVGNVFSILEPWYHISRIHGPLGRQHVMFNLQSVNWGGCCSVIPVVFFLFWGEKNRNLEFLDIKNVFFQPLPPDLLASRRQPGLQSSFGLCHCHWKNGTWILLRSKVWIWVNMRKTSRASGVLQEIIHLISWGSSDFSLAWL